MLDRHPAPLGVRRDRQPQPDDVSWAKPTRGGDPITIRRRGGGGGAPPPRAREDGPSPDHVVRAWRASSRPGRRASDRTAAGQRFREDQLLPAAAMLSPCPRSPFAPASCFDARASSPPLRARWHPQSVSARAPSCVMPPCIAWGAGEPSANAEGAKASAEATVAAAMIRVIVIVVSSPACDPTKPRHASIEDALHGVSQGNVLVRTRRSSFLCCHARAAEERAVLDEAEFSRSSPRRTPS